MWCPYVDWTRWQIACKRVQLILLPCSKLTTIFTQCKQHLPVKLKGNFQRLGLYGEREPKLYEECLELCFAEESWAEGTLRSSMLMPICDVACESYICMVRQFKAYICSLNNQMCLHLTKSCLKCMSDHFLKRFE